MPTMQLRATRKRVTNQLADFKKQLGKDIARQIKLRAMSQVEASIEAGEAQSQLSLICCGKLTGFSIERLLRIRTMLGADIQVIVHDSNHPSFSTTFHYV